MGNLKYITFTR